MLKKTSLSEKEKEKWMKVLSPDMQSSEESDEQDEGVIIVKTLPWRAEKVTKMFRQLDEKIEEGKSAQAKRQRRKRVLGVENSVRSLPLEAPKWAVISE